MFQYRGTEPNLHVAISYGKRDSFNLITSLFPRMNRTTNTLESSNEECFDKVGLKLMCFHALHIFSDGQNLMDIHCFCS